MNFIMIAVLVLGAIGLIAALVLYLCSKKFYVYEDPRIAQVTEQLPGANCGGCGFAGDLLDVEAWPMHLSRVQMLVASRD